MQPQGRVDVIHESWWQATQAILKAFNGDGTDLFGLCL